MRGVTLFNSNSSDSKSHKSRLLDQCSMISIVILSILLCITVAPVTSVSPFDFMHSDMGGSSSENDLLPHHELDLGEQESEDPRNRRNVSLRQADVPRSRSKRGVVQLAGMISCVAGCDPLIYKGYGCYCGYSGRGIPVDGIDRCCMRHDNCYTRTGCSSFKQYVLSYSWDCLAHGYASCAAAYAEGSCAARLCQCDLKFARCLNAYHCPMGRPSCPSSKIRSLFSLMMPFG